MNDVAASLTDQALFTSGGVATQQMVGPAADLVGIDLASNSAWVAGTLVVTPTINFSVQTLSARLDSDVSNYDSQWQPPDVEQGGIGLRLGCVVTTSGTWSPTTADIVVTIWMQPR